MQDQSWGIPALQVSCGQLLGQWRQRSKISAGGQSPQQWGTGMEGTLLLLLEFAPGEPQLQLWPGPRKGHAPST